MSQERKKIKILHIMKMKGVSGSENHLLTLLPQLDPNRFEIHYAILSEFRHVELLEDYQKRLEHAGIPVPIFVMRKYFDFGLFWKLVRYMKAEEFDIVHTHLIHADFYGTLTAKAAGIGRIVSSRHNDDKFRNYLPSIWLNRFLARWHDRLVVISDALGRFLQEVEGIPAEKIVRIHYGLQAKEAEHHADPAYVRQEFQIPEYVPVIGTIGRLTTQKGQRYLVEAVKQVTAHFPELQLVIIGAGELRSELKQQSQELGIAANMIFAGYRTDALKLLSGCDFFVFPSLWEGFGLVLLEAMALKKAIVASRVSAIPESVLNGKTGFLVPPKDADRLADAMLTLLKDPALTQTMGTAGYTHLQENFSVQKMVQGIETMYTDLLFVQSQEETVS